MSQIRPPDDVNSVDGLDFVDSKSGTRYGTIRVQPSCILPIPGHYLAFADDGCGNAFAISPDSHIYFWDHETDELIRLAKCWDGFVAGCHEPEPEEHDPSQIKSAWIDPDFAKQLGIDVPSDGRKKKP